jgi:LysR family pca operon transcriptional activator
VLVIGSRVYVQDFDAVWFVQRGVVDLDLRLGIAHALPIATATDQPLPEAAGRFIELLRKVRR